MNATLLRRPRLARERRLDPLNTHAHSATLWLLAVIATSLSAGVLMAAVVPGWIGADHPAVSRSAPSAGASISTGTDEMPVYELPPVFVVADRKAELAKMQREDQHAAINQAARSKPAPKPPA